LVDSDIGMIRGRFLSEEDRNKLIALARDGSVASRVTRRASALVLLDDGWSCQEVAAALLLNDDTIRGWFKLFEQRGIEGLTSFDVGGSVSFLSAVQVTLAPRCTWWRSLRIAIRSQYAPLEHLRRTFIDLLTGCARAGSKRSSWNRPGSTGDDPARHLSRNPCL
jgi:hypothetical protein